jgi:Phosphoribosylglycinamide synthetase, ATP-grasp (A) domain
MSPDMSVRRYGRDERGDVEDAQDHKRSLNGDKGPNTGSMGAARDAHSALRGYHLAWQLGVAIRRGPHSQRGSASRAAAVSDDVGRLRRGYALLVEQAYRGAARFGEQAH